MRFADIRDGELKIEQVKTGAKLSLAIGEGRQSLINEARGGKLQAVSEFVLHHGVGRGTKPGAALTADWVQNQMKTHMDESGIFDHIPMNERPRMHELRSLGAALYLHKGLSVEEVQSLMGHEEIGSTKGYLEGHEVYDETQEFKAVADLQI